MKYVVLGASAAGINALFEIRRCDKKADITLISPDKHIYSRCILHHFMDGIRDLHQLSFVNADFITQNNIHWLKGVSATGVDCEAKEVLISSGERVPFDKLLIATGSHVFFPPIPGLKEAPNAIGFHDLDECEAIMQHVKTAKHVVVMGAGLVGIDAVSGLLHEDVSLTLLEMKGHMLSMQLDPYAASTYEKAFAEKGVTQLYSVGASGLVTTDDGTITALTLSDGTTLPCDLLIVASGVRANVGFLEGSGIETDRFGLIIDETGKTSHPDIYGAGDVTGRNPIWPVAVKEGLIAASNLCGIPMLMPDFFASKSTMNFLGIPTLSVGLVAPENEEDYLIEIYTDEAGNYKKIVHKDGRICGAILQGDLDYSGILTQLIRQKVDVSKVKKSLFKIDYSDFFNEKDNFEYYFDEEEEPYR